MSNTTMKKKPSPKHCMMYFLLAFLYLSLRVVLAIGSSDVVDQSICEYQDAFLMWPNVPAIEMNKAVYKGDSLIASWAKEFGLVEVPSYKGRLKQMGERAIMIIKTTQSDSGTYKLIYSSPVTNKSEASINLQVRVPPTDYCIPSITHQGDTLQAELPQDDCGVPMLIPKWMNSTENLVGGNISVLKPESRLQPKTYTACAVGTALKCFVGSPEKLCANSTLDAIHPGNDSSSVTDVSVVIIFSSISAFVIGVVSLLVCLKRKCIRRKLCPGTGTTETAEEIPLMESSNIVLTDMKRYLINQYKTMVGVELSPSGEGNFVHVSEVYCDLQITSVGKEDLEERAKDAFLKDILYTDKTYGNTAENVRLTPAVILGQCGIGKSIWCKHLVHEWCIYQDHKEINVKVPIVGKFEILLFVPLKCKLERFSFVECLRNQLFSGAEKYFEDTINYISKHGESVLIIIDGLDAVIDSQEPIVNLLTTKEIFPCTIVLTSRPACLEYLLEKNKIEIRLFEIQGMGLDISLEYAGKVLGILNRSRHKKLTVNQYWDCLRNIQVQSLCRIPFLCLSLIFYWLDRKALSGSITDIKFYIVECYIRRAMTRRRFLDNIGKVLEDNDFDISKPITKIKNKQCLREYGFLLKVMSDVANEIWKLQLQKTQNIKCIENVNLKIDAAQDCVDLCVETGIMIKTVSLKMRKEQTQIAFSHVLLFDFFLALSLAIGKQDSFSGCMPSHGTVSDDCYINLMLQELTTNK